jgi:hypothetical protein
MIYFFHPYSHGSTLDYDRKDASFRSSGEVYFVHINQSYSQLRECVQVAYLDPGNWATAIESGSRFGYDQLWVLVLSNLIAIQLQALSSRLGLASGKHLAQICRDSYPAHVYRLLWLMTEVSIVALDLTMVLGTAVRSSNTDALLPNSSVLHHNFLRSQESSDICRHSDRTEPTI